MDRTWIWNQLKKETFDFDIDSSAIWKDIRDFHMIDIIFSQYLLYVKRNASYDTRINPLHEITEFSKQIVGVTTKRFISSSSFNVDFAWIPIDLELRSLTDLMLRSVKTLCDCVLLLRSTATLYCCALLLRSTSALHYCTPLLRFTLTLYAYPLLLRFTLSNTSYKSVILETTTDSDTTRSSERLRQRDS